MSVVDFNRGLSVGRNGLAQVRGVPAIGNTLTCVVSPVISSPTYQWTRAGVDISGATSSTYTLTATDAGVSVGCRVSGSLTASGAITPWTPAALGSSLLGWWDAERSDLITQSSGSVSSWKDVVAGYDAAQATGASKPAYSASSFNSRPGITFDGVDDSLSLASVPFPTGSSAVEIWSLIDQTALPGDASERVAFSYGGLTANTRRIARAVVGGVNRAMVRIGDGASNSAATEATIDLSGRHVMRSAIGAAASTIQTDSSAAASVSIVPSTNGSATSIGRHSGGASNFWQGVIPLVIVTSTLSTADATKLLAYLQVRGGIS